VAAGTVANETRSALRSGSVGDAVEIELIGVTPDALVDASVWRVSPRGNRSRMDRIPGTNVWTDMRTWYAGVEVAAPDAASLPVSARLRIAAADRTVAVPAPRAGSAEVSVALPLPPAARPSAFGAFAGVANWPGDAVVGARLLASPWALALALASALLAFAALRLRVSEARGLVWDQAVTRAVLVGVLGAAALFFVPAFGSRLVFPLTVEHLEGVQIATIQNWIDGLPLYAAPSSAASGNIYTPGYYLLGRAWAALFGLTLPSLRALTWLLELAMYGSALHIAWRLTGARLAGWLWLPVQLLAFCAIAWIDNANKDAAHTALAMLGASCLVEGVRARRGADVRWALLAGLLWALAFMVKQSHAPIVAAGVIGAALFARRLALPLALSAALCTAGLSLAAWLTWGDAYIDWTLTIPGKHKILLPNLIRPDLVFTIAPWLWIPAVVFLVLHGKRDTRRGDLDAALLPLVLVIAAGAALTGILSIAKDRGGPYALMPALAMLGIVVAIAPRTLAASGVGWVVLLLLLPLPFATRFGISARDRAAADRLIETVRSEPGPVWVPFHPWTSVVAGKPAQVPMFSVGEWMAAGRPLPPALLDSLEQQRFALVITDWNLPDSAQYSYDEEPWLTLRRRYRAVGAVPAEDAFRDKDGWQNVPRILWRPRPAGE
jgi:hypothetical protein